MSIEWMSYFLEQDIPTGPKFVAIALGNRANEEGECWPSYKDIMKQTSISRRSVTNYMQKLEELGYIERFERRRKDGYKSSYGYRLKKISCANFSRENISRANNDDSHVHDVQDKDNNKLLSETSLETKGSKSHLKKQFEIFWKVYPRKVKKKKSEKAYFQALKITTHEIIMTGLEKYKSGKPDYADWQHPCNWLEDESWNDDYGEQKGKVDAKPKSNEFRKQTDSVFGNALNELYAG